MIIAMQNNSLSSRRDTTPSFRPRTIEEMEAELERTQHLEGLQICFSMLSRATMENRSGGRRYAHFLTILREHWRDLSDQQRDLFIMYEGFHTNSTQTAYADEPVEGVDILPMHPNDTGSLNQDAEPPHALVSER